MRYLCFFLGLLLVACQPNSTSTPPPSSTLLDSVVMPSFQAILDSHLLNGSILIENANQHKVYSNDFVWADRGFLPASTFKITNSIIALETQVVEDDSTLFEWDGQPRRLKVWEQDLIFREAFHKSCVPCYQEIARKIGVERMKAHLKKFDYGQMVVDSASIDLFWLEGASKISQQEQIDFLQQFYYQQLPIQARTHELMKKIMLIKKTEDYAIYGKTGWAIRGKNNVGWFVGFVEKGQEVYFFATNVQPQASFDMKKFVGIRKQVTKEALQELQIL